MAEANSTVTFRDIAGFPGYRIGDDGSVWTCKTKVYPLGKRGCAVVLGGDWRRMKPQIINKYLSVMLVGNSGKASRRVHHLVLLAFVGPRPEGMECCHGNGNKLDNRLVNLRWDTRKANAADRNKHGTVLRGERDTKSKLSERVVREARSAFASGGISYAELGRMHGVSPATMRKAVLGIHWGDIA